MYDKDGMYATKVGFYMLWLEYLAISPSYELARRYNAGEWTEADELKRPTDFERVLEVYRDLGDVQRCLFRHWWIDKAFDVFGHQGAKPKVQGIAKIWASKEGKPDITEKAAQYIDGAWRRQGRQRTMIVAVPAGLPKADIFKQVEKLLKTYPEDRRVLRHKTPKYPLLGTRQDKEGLFRYLFVAWIRMKFPNERLWRVGVLAKISSTYSGRLNFEDNPGHGVNTEDRAALKFLTNRAIYRGRMIAENAARGVFPSYAKCPCAVQPDLDEQLKMVIARRKWQKSAERKLAKANATANAKQ